MYAFASDLDEFSERELSVLRDRLHKMGDAELLRYGQAARFLCRDKESASRVRGSVDRGTR